jgi:hypothetical protein
MTKFKSPTDNLSPGFRRVHIECNGVEREPFDDEPFTTVECVGEYEYCVMPVFRSFHGIRIVEPHLNGPWNICEGSDDSNDDLLDDGTRQGWFVWIRLARGVRS